MSEPSRGYCVTTLQQLEAPWSPDDVARAEVSPSHERISCVTKDGRLWVVDCPTGEANLLIRNVADIGWERNSDTDTLLVVSDACKGDVYTTMQFTEKFYFTSNKLSTDFQGSFNSIKLVHCCNRLLISLLDHTTILCQRISSSHLSISWTVTQSSDVVSIHTLNDNYIFVLTTEHEIFCYALQEGTCIAQWTLAPGFLSKCDDMLVDFVFTSNLQTLYLSTGHKLYEVQCQGKQWYDFSLKLGGSKYRNFRRVRKMRTVLESAGRFELGMYRGKTVICAGECLTLFDKSLQSFEGPIQLISCKTRMDVKMPAFLQNDYLKVLYHGISVRSVLQQILEGKGSSTAEKICKLNSWSNISMDLAVLKQGIISEHYDMVQFFFKTRQELSHSVLQTGITDDEFKVELKSWLDVFTEVEKSTQMRREFSERVTKIMLSAIAQLLHWVSSVETASLVQEEFVKVLCSKMNVFRGLLLTADSVATSEEMLPSVFPTNPSWVFFSEEEVIQDAMQSGVMDQAKAFLRKREQDDGDLFNKASKIGLELVLDYVLLGQTSDAYRLMENLGWDVDEKLNFFFLHVKSQDARVTILKEIMKRTGDTAQLIDLLGKMEVFLKHYSCPGIKGILASSPTAEAISTTGSLLEGKNVALIENHIQEFDDEKCPKGKYSGIVLSWLQQWDQETFDSVLLHSGSAAEEMKEMDPYLVWNNMLKYAKMNQIEKLMNCVADNSGEVFCDSLPLFTEITCEMLDVLEEKKVLPDVAQHLTLQLARKGLISEIILEDFQRLLNTMSKIKVSVYDLFDVESFIDKHDFVHRMIHFCLANNYIHFLHIFLSKVEIQPTCAQCLTTLLSAIFKYNEWQAHPERIEDAALAFAKDVYGTDNINKLWADERIRLASIICFLRQDWSSVPRTVMHKLPLPLAGYIQDLRGEQKEDISIYQLLQRSTVFDPSKLFGFQRGNNIYEGEPVELPYFSLEKLVEEHGIKEPLTYVYYLLKYRPGCALDRFFKDYSATPSVLKAASKQVSRLALNGFTDDKLVAVSIAFIEAITQDSANLRLLVNVGLRLLPRCDKKDLIENLCHVFSDSFSTLTASQNAAYKETAQVIMHDLDSSVREEFAKDKSKVPLLGPKSPVILLHDYCKVYQLETPCTVLELCAEADNWLGFIVWAQVLQISRRQIIPILKSFSNSVYREHLEKALSQVSSLKDATTKSSVNPRRKDLRASLYSKIGVVKPPRVIDTCSYSPPDVKKDSNSDPDSFSVTSDESSLTQQSINTTGSGGSGRSYPSNLVDLVVSCDNSSSPVNELLTASIYHWNPTPALIATHYSTQVEQCFATWLETTTIICHTRHSNDRNFGSLLECAENALKLRCLPSLRLGYLLFMPESVVLPLVNYLYEVLSCKNYSAGDDHWKAFVEKYNKDKTEKDFIRLILIYGVLICESVYEQRLLLKKYRSLTQNVTPNFVFFSQVLESVADVNWELPFDSLLLGTDTEEIDKVLRREVTRLIQAELYETAIKFCKTSCLPLDDVLCELLDHQMNKKCRRPSWALKSPTDFDMSIDSPVNSIIEQVAEVRTRHLFRRDLSMSLKSCVSRDDPEGFVSSLGAPETPISQRSSLFRNESVESTASTNTVRFRKISILAALKSVDNVEVKEKSFWDRAHTLFRKHNVNGATAFMFFKKKVDHVDTYRDKFIAIKFALRWSDSEMHRVTCWQYAIKCVENGELDILEDLSCEQEELVLLKRQELPQSRVLIENQQEKTALSLIVDSLLSKVAFEQAQFLATVFQLESIEYLLAVTCIQLAQGLVIRETVHSSVKSLLDETTDVTLRRARLSNSVDSESCRTIEDISFIAHSSRSICRRVLLLHLLATSLSLEYASLAKESDPLKLLKRVLNAKLSNKFFLARELISVYSIEDAVLSSFIYAQVQKSLSFKDDEFTEFDMLGNFEQVVSLCKDPTLVGNRIFFGLKKEDDLQLETDRQVLYNEVELCILAHGCFSVACCMEGISHVLKHTHLLVQWLIRYDTFSLMVRLLTGIGRYSEMSYIFDALNEHDRFELLFQKGMEKVPHLKVALLDYLKKRKDSTHLDAMFKLNFTMHREIAEMLADSAAERLTDIAGNDGLLWPSTWDSKYVSCSLDVVMTDYADAAESYVKADCLLHALNCATQAELIALQLYFIGEGKNVKIINLNQEALNEFVNSHGVYAEARLVADAHPSLQYTQWYVPIFSNVIVHSNWNYLKDYQIKTQLTSDTVSKMADSYRRYPKQTPSMQANMEKLLEGFPCLETQYRCAQELNLVKLAAKIMNKNTALKDLLAKKG